MRSIGEEVLAGSPIRLGPVVTGDPRYCESEWVAAFYRMHPGHRAAQ